LIEITEEQASKLKSMSRHDEDMIETLADIQVLNIEKSGLDPKTHALCRLAALVALDAPLASYAWQASVATESGVTLDDTVGVLIALAPTVGLTRIVAAANKIAALHGIEAEDIWEAA